MNGFNKGRLLIVALASTVFAVASAQARPIAYPAKGQSPQQQHKDDSECYSWARGATGIDPAAVSSAPVAAQQPAVGGGERVAGAVRGAVIGGIIGGGDGAAKGAGVGVVVGGAHARQNQRSRQSQEQARRQEQINTFYRAHTACMEGRGYSVK